MQKKLIALAVAGLASAGAFAQSNVTVYGVADMYVGSFKTDGMERSTQVNSGGLAGSRIGFKGVEDLGNGLKAIFTMEYALGLDKAESTIRDYDDYNELATNYDPVRGSYYENRGNGTGIGQARQSFVGLTGGFGTVVAGRLQTAGYDWQQKVDVLGGTAIDPLGAVGSSFLIGSTTAALRRADNAVAYISPSFSGVTVALNRGYALEESGAKGAETNAIANLVSVSYEAGPLYVGGVYANLKGKTAGVDVADVREWALGAAYDFKVVKLTASFQQQKDNLADTNTNNAWSLGAAVPVSAAGTIIGSFAKNNIKSTAADDNTKSWTLAYAHGLSKRTTAYAGYTSINPNGDNNDTQAFVAGVNHKF